MTTKKLLIMIFAAIVCLSVTAMSAHAGSGKDRGGANVALSIGVGGFGSPFFSAYYGPWLPPVRPYYLAAPVYYSPVIVPYGVSRGYARPHGVCSSPPRRHGHENYKGHHRNDRGWR